MTDPRKEYRTASIQGGSLPDVFIQAYDRIAVLLHSAASAIEAHDIEKKTVDLNRALEIIFHLQNALNLEKGGEVAQTLARFYSLIWREIIKGSAKLDGSVIREAAAHVAEVRKIWEQSLTITAAPAAPQASGARPANPYAASPMSPPPAQEAHTSSNNWTA